MELRIAKSLKAMRVLTIDLTYVGLDEGRCSLNSSGDFLGDNDRERWTSGHCDQIWEIGLGFQNSKGNLETRSKGGSFLVLSLSFYCCRFEKAHEWEEKAGPFLFKGSWMKDLEAHGPLIIGWILRIPAPLLNWSLLHSPRGWHKNLLHTFFTNPSHARIQYKNPELIRIVLRSNSFHIQRLAKFKLCSLEFWHLLQVRSASSHLK